MTIVDLFAGPGGWSEGLAQLGHREIGIEWDAAACATARAAGHERLQADVAELDPVEFAPCEGLIASPPCQAWSTAGKGGGRRDQELVVACALEVAAGNDTRAEHAAKCEDARSMLVVEPLRWALALKPQWIACEQVPPVMELWTVYAQVLEQNGYRCWAGILSAERYGVPQTRKRAVLMARLGAPIAPPAPTHQAYVPGEPAEHQYTLEGELLPWVSMARALGWRDGDEVGFPRRNDRDDGGEYRERDLRTGSEPAFNVTEKARSWTVRNGMNSSKHSRDPDDKVPYERSVDDPAPTVDGKVGSAWKVAPEGEHVDPPMRWKLRAGTNANDVEREADEPAPTVRFGARLNEVAWVRNDRANATVRDATEPAPTITGGHDHGERQWIVDTGNTRSGQREEGRWRETEDPAPAVTTRADQLEWRGDGPTHLDTRQSHAQARPVDEPSPVLPGANLAKGASVWTDDPATETTEGTGYKPSRGVRVSLDEAAVLQGFRADYPWQGTRSKQFEQVGNAVPPPLARAVLSELVAEADQEQAA